MRHYSSINLLLLFSLGLTGYLLRFSFFETVLSGRLITCMLFLFLFLCLAAYFFFASAAYHKGTDGLVLVHARPYYILLLLAGICDLVLLLAALGILPRPALEKPFLIGLGLVLLASVVLLFGIARNTTLRRMTLAPRQ